MWETCVFWAKLCRLSPWHDFSKSKVASILSYLESMVTALKSPRDQAVTLEWHVA